MLSNKEIDAFRQLEEAFWREETRFDIQYIKDLMAEDFIEVGRSGRIYDKSSILAAQRQPINAVIPLSNFSVRLLSDKVVQTTYDSCVTRQSGALYARRSSIWSREVDGWQLRFHQGTPYEPVA